MEHLEGIYNNMYLYYGFLYAVCKCKVADAADSRRHTKLSGTFRPFKNTYFK